MEFTKNPQITNAFASLGSLQGETYIINSQCLSILQEIQCKLSMEDHTLRTFRRAIGFGQNVKKDIVPLILNAKDSTILDTSIRLMVNLTVPTECLLAVDVMSRTEIGRHTIYEINQLLYTSKESFIDFKLTKAIIDHMKMILETNYKLSLSQCESINYSLLLFRNILHIPNQQQSSAMQNQIIWNLFTQSIDKLLIHLISCSQRAYWGVTIAQLIALMYQDQHVVTLQKLLNQWIQAASHADSSDDNESNTSLPKRNSGGSSPMLTSDSSDNGKMETNDSENGQLNNSTSSMNSDMTNEFDENNLNWIHKPKAVNQMMKQQTSELSDCGYQTQVSQGDLQNSHNPVSFSTSSNDDDSPTRKPAHQKPPSTNQKQRFNAAQKQCNLNAASVSVVQDSRRKKLIKRSRSSIINVKGHIHHKPSDEDISNILKEFTVDFLLKGYGLLVQDLHIQLLNNPQPSPDTSHFLWLVTYFLKFAVQLDFDLEQINTVLCFDIISYLTFEGVNLCEQMELMSRQEGSDLNHFMRRIHLVVTAIREFLQTLKLFKRKTHTTDEDKSYIARLTKQICGTEDLRNLFVLLLRCVNPNLKSRKYLQDVIVSNHLLLLFYDEEREKCGKFSIDMVEHVAQFATVDIMHQYGILLESFRDNGRFVNDCCFTMMHHVAGDVGQVAVLFQPNILKAYSQIWDAEYEICDDWKDLIEFVIHKFINTPSRQQKVLPIPAYSIDVHINDIWAQEEIDSLYWYYIQSKKHKDIVGHIIKQINDSGQKTKSRMAVIQQLLQQEITSKVEYDDLMKFEDSQYKSETKKSKRRKKSRTKSGIERSESFDAAQADDVKLLRDRLVKENKGMQIAWLQKLLIECCFIKLNMTNELRESKKKNMEPVAYHCILKNQPIPLIPFNTEQQKILVYQPFVLLLHKLGFHLPTDANKLFVRIPETWKWDVLLNVAEKLGPIPAANLKFDIDRLRKTMKKFPNSTSSVSSDI